MVQGADGYWYAYIVESNEIAAADANANLEYGVVTAAGSNTSPLTFNSGIVSVYTSTTSVTMNVVDNAPSLSPKNNGQVSVLTADQWPFIQTLDFTLETIEIRYEQPGPDEVVTLKHDNDDIDDFAGIEIDRQGGHNNAHVHLTITDQALNLDPTAEDVVMFYVAAGSEGVAFNADSRTYNAFSNGFDDNGKLKINYDANGSGTTVLTNNATIDDTSADNYLIFYESAENSGVFYNTDDDDASNLLVSSAAKRGTTATIDYNDSAQSYIVQLTLQPLIWMQPPLAMSGTLVKR
jgi:hypothetical protein